MTSMLAYCVVTATLVTLSISKFVDLSHKHGKDTLFSVVGVEGYNLTNVHKGESVLGAYVEVNIYSSLEHGGTHMDSPSHFIKGARTLDDIPLERTILEGVMIDYSKEAALNRSFVASLQSIKNWEKKYGQIPPDAAILFYFGWYQKFTNEAQYKGTSNSSNYRAYTYPTISFEAAKWLLDERSVITLGSDTLSVEPYQINGQFSGFPVHVYYLSRDKILVENLRDLDRLPPRGFRFHASPVKYIGASGAQIRAYANVYEPKSSDSYAIQMSSIIVICFSALHIM